MADDPLKVPEGTSPPVRTKRNIGMAMWLTVAAAISGGAGLAFQHWTPIPLLMTPVFLLGALVYVIMAGASRRQQPGVRRLRSRLRETRGGQR